MGVAEPKYKMEVKAGDVVRINDGPFKDFEGAINAIDEEKGKIKILSINVRTRNPGEK